VPDIADEHEAAARQAMFGPFRVAKDLVFAQPPRLCRSALLEAFFQIAPDHAEPVAIAEQFVLGIDCGDRILKVGDRGQCRFEDDVADSGLVGFTDRVVGCELHFDVQAIVAEQQAVIDPADEGALIGKVDILRASDIAPAPARQRQDFVEEPASFRDHRIAARAVVPAGLWRRRVERIGASYRLPHRALAALRRKRALRMGTTSCGPAMVAISGSTFSVPIVNASGSGTR
jgi:hypothetical protein